MPRLRYTIYDVNRTRPKRKKDYADRSWTEDGKRENSLGIWLGFAFFVVLLIVANSDLIERILS